MDKNLIFIMIAASVCGSYNNEANRPEPFQGRFAKAIENHRYPKTLPKPHYLTHYGVISASEGNIYKTILNNAINPLQKIQWFNCLMCISSSYFRGTRNSRSSFV